MKKYLGFVLFLLSLVSIQTNVLADGCCPVGGGKTQESKSIAETAKADEAAKAATPVVSE